MNFFNIASQFFWGGLLSLITITNPLSKVPLFIGITKHMSDEERLWLARRSCLYAFLIMVSTLFTGALVLQLFGISYAALRIAGGFTIALMGYRMLFQNTDANFAPTESAKQFAFFPLALPAISGPGTIAVVIGISTEAAELNTLSHRLLAYGTTIFSMALVCILIWFVMRGAQALSKVLGRDGTEVTTRLMGFLLVCVGVQFIVSGIQTFWVTKGVLAS
jgi:multiple antibiotic resistance protein